MTPGTTYLVPCHQGFAVLLPAHHDQESPAVGWHLHIDRRFEDVPEGHVLPHVGPLPAITIERRRCIAASPTAYRHPEIEALEVYHGRYCRVARDGRCPHQGLPVRAGRQLADGSRLCPGHGLRFDRCGALIAGDDAEVGLWSLAQ